MKMFSCCKKEKGSHPKMMSLGIIGLLVGIVGALVLTAHKPKSSSGDNEPNLLYVPIK